MMNQLQLLEQTILELKARYNITATELVNLKHKLAHDDSPRQISDLQLKLSHSQETIDALNAKIKELTQSRDALQTQAENLYEENQSLMKQNQELNKKNTLAISRAEVIQKWLTKIDNQHT